MEFVNPSFLYGLFAIAIPVIIHLFNFRRFRKVFFSNIRFLKEIQVKTKRQSRLLHLLVLLMRILLITCLVLSFSQPYIRQSGNKIDHLASNAVSVYIDNSFSMSAFSEKGNLLDLARLKALEVASIYKASDEYQVLTNDFEGRHRRFTNRDLYTEMVNATEISPVYRSFQDVIRFQSDLLKSSQAKVRNLFYISDFQKLNFEKEWAAIDTSLNIYLVPVNSPVQGNLYIDSCWLRTPVQQTGQKAELSVRIVNNSDEDYEKMPLKLLINGSQKALASFDVTKNSFTELTLSYTIHETGIHSGEVQITDNPVTFDDRFFFSYTVMRGISVLAINGREENYYLETLFANDSLFRYRSVPFNTLDISSVSSQQLVILNGMTEISSGLSQTLNVFVKSGGSLVVIPSAEMNTAMINSFLASCNSCRYGLLDTADSRVSYMNTGSSLFADVFDEIPENVDLPVTSGSFSIQCQVKQEAEPLLELRNGNHFLVKNNFGKGRIYLFATPFDTKYTNFTRHAIFVPALYRIALLSGQHTRLFYTIGKPGNVELSGTRLGPDEVFKIRSLSEKVEFIPAHISSGGSSRVFLDHQVLKAGNYELMHGDSVIMGISFNYNRRESALQCYTIDELQKMIRDSGNKKVSILKSRKAPLVQELTEISQGIRLGKLFLILALLFAGIEIVLLRFFNK